MSQPRSRLAGLAFGSLGAAVALIALAELTMTGPTLVLSQSWPFAVVVTGALLTGGALVEPTASLQALSPKAVFRLALLAPVRERDWVVAAVRAMARRLGLLAAVGLTVAVPGNGGPEAPPRFPASV